VQKAINGDLKSMTYVTEIDGKYARETAFEADQETIEPSTMTEKQMSKAYVRLMGPRRIYGQKNWAFGRWRSAVTQRQRVSNEAGYAI
jgi:hypothetical protein